MTKDTVDEHTYVVILAGGGGTRLWPRSRVACPKQFLQIVGDKTMLQLTADRALQLVPWERIIIVTNRDHLRMVQEQLPAAKAAHIIL
ncbi:MAG: sugar phosphate nucleotidyltransferase, partial [bacterium]|nr:sugar phosphate nucleotidyltransferase [bacterium]